MSYVLIFIICSLDPNMQKDSHNSTLFSAILPFVVPV